MAAIPSMTLIRIRRLNFFLKNGRHGYLLEDERSQGALPVDALQSYRTPSRAAAEKKQTSRSS
jgi:hypothetical protein